MLFRNIGLPLEAFPAYAPLHNFELDQEVGNMVWENNSVCIKFCVHM